MKCEIVNKKLDIRSCRLADLTAKQVSTFLDGWEEGASIGSLTMFVKPKTGTVYLNRDNKNYELYRSLTELYLISDKSMRDELEQKAPEEMKESFCVLKSAVIHREIWKALQNSIDHSAHDAVLDGILKKYSGTAASINIAFRYGMMCGKRQERERRRGEEAWRK